MHTHMRTCAQERASRKPTTPRAGPAESFEEARRKPCPYRSRDPGRLWEGGEEGRRGAGEQGSHTAPNDRTRRVHYVLGTYN